MKGLPSRTALCIVPDVNVSPLSILRLATPGAPRLRAIARKIGCSPEALSKFESGQLDLRAELVRKYARAVKSTPKEVRRRFLYAALAFHHDRMVLIRREMRSRGMKTSGGRRLALSA